jgi:hypothetical protein
MRQCIDAATDRAMQSSGGAFAQAACPKRDVQQTATGITIDSTCTLGGKPATSNAVVTGSFDSAYTMTVTSKGEALQGGGTTVTYCATTRSMILSRLPCFQLAHRCSPHERRC